MKTLEKIDREIIRAIGASKLNATKIAQKTGFGRTTINYRVKKLLGSKMISKSSTIGRKVMYSVNRKAVNEARESRLVEVFSGKNITQAYEYFSELPKRAVIYGIQGVGAIENLFKILPADFITNTHQKQKGRSILIKGFTNNKILSVLEKANPKLIQSHIGRAVGVKLLVGDELMGQCEVLSYKTVLLITDTIKKRTLILKDKAITVFLYEIFSILYDNTENIPVFKLNEYFKKLSSDENKL